MGRGVAVAALVVVAAVMPAHAQLAAGDPATRFELTTVVSQLATPTDVAPLPDGRLVIIEQGGGIHLRRADGTVQRRVTTVPGMLDASSEKGLLGVVADPEFAQNRTLYFYASVGDVANKHKVLKATLSDVGAFTWAATPVVDMNLQGPANHDGGGLVIHRGQLYVSVGDTGANDSPPTNHYASCLDRANGKILRVNLDGSTPADNPLAAQAVVTGCDGTAGPFADRAPDERIYAWGLRNPFRFWIDPATDRMWIGDVGEVTKEEISVTPPVGVSWSGLHLGYPFVEGTKRWGQTLDGIADCGGIKPSRACTPPVYDYDHDGTVNCVIGGLVPDDCGWPAEYRARYLFGDHGSGVVYSLDLSPDRSGVIAGSRRDFATVGPMTSFRLGPDGALWVTSDGAGALLRIRPRVQAACPPDAGADVAPDVATALPDAPAAPPYAAPAAAKSSGGCGCSTPGARGPFAPSLAMVAVALAARRLTRRRRRGPGAGR